MIKLSEKSDKLSPMLIKELRQGMRTKSFLLAFCLMQGLMMLFVFTSVLDPNPSDWSLTFWGLVSIPVLFFLSVNQKWFMSIGCILFPRCCTN